MSKNRYNLLITGGAGFIGSNLVEKFINDNRISLIRVVDDLSNGYFVNIKKYIDHPKFEFIQGDICDYNVCMEVTKGIDKVSHQAGLGSVPRSVENPMRTTEVNVLGTVNLLHACHVNKIDRIVLACSSSTYGDSHVLPKLENNIGKPLSPYAVSKYAVEVYADIFFKTYGLNHVCLRYFNVFGPRQNPDNPYAAVIPIFCKAIIEGKEIIINGDGKTSRDFTYISNVIYANELSLFSSNENALNQVYNVACGECFSLNQIIEYLNQFAGTNINPTYKSERPGDVKHSLADISKIKENLGFVVQTNFRNGLEQTYDYLKQDLKEFY